MSVFVIVFVFVFCLYMILYLCLVVFNQRGFSCFPPAGCCGSVSVALPAGEHLSCPSSFSFVRLLFGFYFVFLSDFFLNQTVFLLSINYISKQRESKAGEHLSIFLPSPSSDYFSDFFVRLLFGFFRQIIIGISFGFRFSICQLYQQYFLWVSECCGASWRAPVPLPSPSSDYYPDFFLNQTLFRLSINYISKQRESKAGEHLSLFLPSSSSDHHSDFFLISFVFLSKSNSISCGSVSE